MAVLLAGSCILPRLQSGWLLPIDRCESIGWVYTDHGCFDGGPPRSLAPHRLATQRMAPHRCLRWVYIDDRCSDPGPALRLAPHG